MFSGSEKKIALVEVNGIILDSREIIRQLSKYQRDRNVLGIVLRINSPGGAVAPSQEIYNAVLKIKENQKQIFASLGSLAASGGYYVASAANFVVANPGTLTGSIGVIMTFSNFQELIQKIGVRPEVIKSGKFKDTGSPHRALTAKERDILQKVVDDVHLQFIEAVAHGRDLPVKEVARLADGRIFTGRQALDLKMVDKLGGLEDTIALLAKKVGIEGRPKVIQEEKSLDFIDWILQGALSRTLKKSLVFNPYPSLQYLWTGG